MVQAHIIEEIRRKKSKSSAISRPRLRKTIFPEKIERHEPEPEEPKEPTRGVFTFDI